MKVEVISREMIKPSSPTPPHLKTYELSLLDQIQPSSYIPLVFFYTSDDSNDRNKDEYFQQSHRLKESLSETLTCFYPLAGRIKDNLLVDFNNTGVDYVEAQVNCKLLDVLGRSEVEVLHQFLPCDVMMNAGASDSGVLLAVQVNIFDCGGLAIGVCAAHKIVDASTLSTFINSWAATMRGDSDNIVHPTFGCSSIFPPKAISQFNPATGLVGEKVITRRFIFDASNIAALRAKAASNSTLPTRVEAISALIWKCTVTASRSLFDADQCTLRPLSMAMVSVNMRSKMVPQLPKHLFGNLVTVAVSTAKSELDWYELVDQLHHSIKKVNPDYIRYFIHKIRGSSDEGSKTILDSSNQRPKSNPEGEVKKIIFTSWCRFGLYKADFGWGEPAWVSVVNVPYKNVVLLMDTKGCEGIEAWVSLIEEDMAMFERYPELLEFVSSTHPV